MRNAQRKTPKQNNQKPNGKGERCLRQELIKKCSGAPLHEILSEIGKAVRFGGGLWSSYNIGRDQQPIVEISVFGVLAYGSDGSSACRNWLTQAQNRELEQAA